MKSGTLKVMLLLLVALQVTQFVVAQSQTYPVIGQQLPPVTLTDVHYYTSNKFQSADQQGKWLIMDFWSQGCTACVKSFPKLNSLQQEFRDSIQFILVGNNDRQNKNIKKIYERFRQAQNLELTVAFDSAIFNQFGVVGVPHIIVVDPEQKVYAVTGSGFLEHDNILKLIRNQKPSFVRSYSAFDKRSQEIWKYWVKDKETLPDEILYQSILTPYNGEVLTGGRAIESRGSQELFQTVAIPVKDLYLVAYDWYAMYDPANPYAICSYPVLEVSDSSPFLTDYNNMYRGLYNYSVAVPQMPGSRARLLRVMQDGLRALFGYHVVIENRMMPYWSLTATENARKKLATKSDKFEYEGGPSGLTGKRIDSRSILSNISLYKTADAYPMIDETNISGYIDFKFTAAMTDMADIKKELAKQGLILELKRREMKVLVIRDPVTP